MGFIDKILNNNNNNNNNNKNEDDSNSNEEKDIKYFYCSFCGKSQNEVIKLIAGPSVYICSECVDLCNDIIREELSSKNNSELDELDIENHACSFCSKQRNEVQKLIEGSEGYICNKCIEESVHILKNEGHQFSFDEDKIYQLEELGITPAFKKLKFNLLVNHCFYLCPFSEPFNTIYNDHVKIAIQSAGFSVERADEIYGVGNVIDDVWEGINKSTVIIADVTTKNPNVLYEIGISHTIGKPVVIITQSIEDVPFDLRHRRSIIYEYTPRGCSSLEKQIINTLEVLKTK